MRGFPDGLLYDTVTRNAQIPSSSAQIRITTLVYITNPVCLLTRPLTELRTFAVARATERPLSGEGSLYGYVQMGRRWDEFGADLNVLITFE